jgi:hypothetical protein
MRIHTSEVERNVWAQRVRVSRMKNGRWVIDRGNCSTELPANTFTCWEHAEWTGNAWANEEYEQSLAETE